VDLQPVSDDQGETVPDRGEAASAHEHERPWRPLGALLVEKGLVAETDVQQAVEEKRRHQDRRLGEILVERGHISPSALASALAEQHGVSLETQMEGAELGSAPRTLPDRPTYRVCAVAWEPAGEQRTALYESPNLLDAADFACEYADREDPLALEIERRGGKAVETVWTYSRERAAAEAASSKALVETFGFDPTRWGVDS
jgi:hypothetical protein